jgi:hypothetical protein
VNLLNTRSSNSHAKIPIPEKPSKSGLMIRVWHKDNLYLDTSTIGNGNPHPTNINSRTTCIRMTPRSQLFFDKLFFSSLENQGREINPPPHNKCDKRNLLIWKLRNPYIFGYTFIYSDSRLKQTLINESLMWTYMRSTYNYTQII